ncbi:MAG: VOC family protein [Myxococcota bacterium]|jgi:catechol 2,3-dioxygenase-like lactoylglutathione lyase family enzyme|nr:VOC family protein [Myxococcota bacterium]
MLTKGTHHVSLSVEDLDAARRFYGDLLGLPEIERPDFGFPGTWYQAGPVQLHLIETPESMRGGPEASTGGKGNPIANHIAFEIEDYAATRVRLEAAGFEVTGLGENVGQMFVGDPGGNTVEFIAPGGQLGRIDSDRSQVDVPA